MCVPAAFDSKGGITVDLNLAQYIEINMTGIVILLLMLFYVVRMHLTSDSRAYKLFSYMLLCNVGLLLADTFISFANGHASQTMFAVNHLSSVVYYLLHAYFGYIWCRYCVASLYPGYKPKKHIRALALIPLAANTFITVLSPWTEWVYSLSENNSYMRGTFLPAIIVLSYSYWIFSAFLVVHEMILQRQNREKSMYLTLLFFPVPTIIGNVIQLRFYGLTITWICSAVSLLLIFIDLQNTLLSRDTLTGLFNRRQTNKQLAWESEHLNSASPLYVIMTDVDHFKKINDVYGHVMGDRALTDVANILRASLGYEDFIGRFGGDEFIVIGHAKDRASVERLIERIRKNLADCNSRSTEPYVLSLSMGYAIFDGSQKITPDSIISLADKEMYREKTAESGKSEG